MNRPTLDRLRQAAKRAQRRLYFADYEDLDRYGRWQQPQHGVPYDEFSVEVVPEPATVGSVLVFKPDEIGDAVYALPAVVELRRQFPAARLTLLCRALTRPLYERTGLFDQIVTVESLSQRGRPRAEVPGTPFDLSVYLRTYPAGFRNFLAVPARARVHPADPRLRSDSVLRPRVSLWSDDRRHQVLQLLEIVGLLTRRSYGFDDVAFPAFRWTTEDAEPYDGLRLDPQTRVVVVHPFAKDETRRYPAAYWPRLWDLIERDHAVTWVAIGAREDGGLPERPNLIQTQGTLTLSQTGYLLERADAFVGNISGPAHWAAALGTPTVTLMSGHSLPVEWAPLGNSLVVRRPVPCAPCHQKTCPIYELACLTEMTPDRVVGRVSEFLAHLPTREETTTVSAYTSSDDGSELE